MKSRRGPERKHSVISPPIPKRPSARWGTPPVFSRRDDPTVWRSNTLNGA